MTRSFLPALALAVLALPALSPGALAEPARGPARPSRPAQPTHWTDAYPSAVEDVRSGAPLTILVMVPLCDSALIACGGRGAGDPGSLDKNLYWGRAFGARRYFDESARQWRRVSREPGEGPVLEQLVYRRKAPAWPWGAEQHGRTHIEQLVVLRAVHGRSIDAAVRDFYDFATQGAEVTFHEDGTERRARVHVAGYAGHNRLMDGVELGALTTGLAPRDPSQAIPSFVFACHSAPYFGPALRQAGSEPLVMTRDFVAPEGYVIEAVARGLGDRASPSELRRRVVAAYARWQRLPERVAGSIFAR